MRLVPLIAALLFAMPLAAQIYEAPWSPGNIYTPEIRLGSATVPSTVTVPPVELITPFPPEAYFPPEPYASYPPPADTDLLATRHFDYLISPVAEFFPGSMQDTSISLGEYCRRLRKQHASANPNVIPQPEDRK